MECTISSLDRKGRGIAETDRGPLAVPFTVPGDRIVVEPRGKRKGVRIGRMASLVAPSPDRVAPQCPYAGSCGGCPWQMFDYPAQLREKRAALTRALDGIVTPPIPDVIPSPDLSYYRNRMDYVVAPDGTLGLREPGSWKRVLDLETCFLLSENSVELMRRFRAWMRERRVSAWNQRTHEGFLRYLVIREGKRTGERMAIVVTSPGEFPARSELIAALAPLTTSIVWGIRASVGDASIAEELRVLHGTNALHEQLRIGSSPSILSVSDGSRATAGKAAVGGEGEMREGAACERSNMLTFEIPPLSFFQTNTTMADTLLETVYEFAAPTSMDSLVDLYCGVGSFAIALAPAAGRVVGIESDRAAIDAAKRNAIANGVPQVQFVHANVEDWRSPIDSVDVLTLDPPRTGLHPTVIDRILHSQPERIVYVSCNPDALGRDLRFLTTRYHVDAIRAFDLFPHTPHVESIARLVLE